MSHDKREGSTVILQLYGNMHTPLSLPPVLTAVPPEQTQLPYMEVWLRGVARGVVTK